MATAPHLRDALARELATGPAVLLDLSRVTFMDSTALLVIWQAVTEAKMHGRQLLLDGRLSEPVRRVMEITQLLPLLPLAS